jgi:hypothetical protein
MAQTNEGLILLARLGYVARGLVYALLGYLALSATGTQTVRDGQAGALAFFKDVPGGSLILGAAALGLLGYAIFRFSTALLDTERHGTDAKAIAVRAGYFVSAVIHLGLSWSAMQFAMGARQQPGDSTHDMVSAALDHDLGDVALGLAGVALIGAALFQAWDAVKLDFMKRVSAQAPAWTCWIGRIGYAARAVVFLAMGWSLMRSGWFERTSEARSLGQAILDLREFGTAYTLVAAGLVLFGAFSLIVARYRIIPEIDAHGRVARMARRVA